MFIEVIATSIDDVKKINQSSLADQIEYCIELDKGGTTPKLQDIKHACEISRTPIRVMVRTNEKYTISDLEFKQMKEDIVFIKKNTKALGVVIGWVDTDNNLELNRLEELVKLAFPLKVTFHRAFDQVNDNFIHTANKLFNIGVDTVLTTGNKTGNAIDNIDNLLKLQASSNIRVLCGKGVDKISAKVFQEKKLLNLHIGSVLRVDNSWNKPIDINKLNSWYK